MVTPAVLGPYSSTAPPASWRNPRSLTTLTWRDGELDAVFVTVPEGALSADEIIELNDELRGRCYIVNTHRKSHMWDKEICMVFLYDFLSMCLKVRRGFFNIFSFIVS